MAVLNIAPAQSVTFPLSGKYLVARRVSGNVVMDDPQRGLPEFSFRQGDNIEFSGSNSIRLTNRGAVPAQVDIESSPVRIYGNEGSAISIIGGEITRILEPISVTAEATVENGTITSQSQSDNFDSVDINVPASSRLMVIAADAEAVRRTVIIQNISNTETELRVGGSTVASNRGVLITGSKSAPAAIEFDGKGAFYVFNASAQVATVAVMWGKK